MSQAPGSPRASSLPRSLERPTASAVTSVESLAGVDNGDVDSFSAFKFLRCNNSAATVDDGFSLVASNQSLHCNNRDVCTGPASTGVFRGVGSGATSSVGSAELVDDDLRRVWSDDYLDAASEPSGRFFRRELNTARLSDDVEPSVSVVGSKPSDFGIERCSWMLQVDQPKFFWETDPFLKTMFGTGELEGPSLKRPEPPIDLTVGGYNTVWDVLKRPKPDQAVGICSSVIKHVEVRDEKDKRVSIISNWSSLVCINLEAFSLSDTLTASNCQVTHADVEMSLTACFSRKATSTLSKRFYCMNRYVNHCSRNGLQFFPVKEHIVFTYLKHLLDDERTSPSAGRSFLEALRFTCGVIGLKGDLAILGSTRVDGLAVELMKRAGPIQQAAPLTVAQVVALEKLVANCDALKDKLIFGGLIILLYSCGRFSDGQRAVHMILDADLKAMDSSALGCQGFLELQVLGHKGARGDVLKRTFLPLVAPIYSMGGSDWFRAWVQAREVMGLTVNGRLEKPLLCRFSPTGEPLDLELTSAECSALLRRALKVEQDKWSTMRSHSLKATALSWCCKHGVDISTRRLLGHHLDPGSRSAETYGRDSMGPAVRTLVSVLDDIKKGRFKPDESRSGRFVEPRQPDTEADEPQTQLDEDESSDSDYVPSSSDTDEDDELFGPPSESALLWHLVMPQLRPGFVDVPDEVMVHRNVASGVQHLKWPGQLKFMCGRRLSDRYQFYAGKPIKGVALCDPCIGCRDLQGADNE